MSRSREYLFWYALTLLDTSPKTIVDIGATKSMAPKAFSSYGYSALAWLCSEAIVHTVDTDPKAVANTRRLVRSRLGDAASKRLETHCLDGVDFLRAFNSDIDILYIDGPGEVGSIECAIIASERLKHGSLLLFDDCDGVPDGRRKAAEIASELGFEIIKDTQRQILLRKQ